MSDEERTYLYYRAEEEIIRARDAEDPLVVSFHYRLGNLYLDRVFGRPDAEGGSEERASF